MLAHKFVSTCIWWCSSMDLFHTDISWIFYRCLPGTFLDVEMVILISDYYLPKTIIVLYCSEFVFRITNSALLTCIFCDRNRSSPLYMDVSAVGREASCTVQTGIWPATTNFNLQVGVVKYVILNCAKINTKNLKQSCK